MDSLPTQNDRTSVDTASSESNAGAPNICGVCLAKYNEGRRIPKSLLCGHSFCRSCIQSLINVHISNKVVCPLCRAEHRSRLQDIPTNYQLLQLLTKDKILCTEPESRPPSPILPLDEAAKNQLESHLSQDLQSVIRHYTEELENVQRRIQNIGLDINKVMPSRRRGQSERQTWLSNGRPPRTAMDTARLALNDINRSFQNLLKDVGEIREVNKFIDECMANGACSVDPSASFGLNFESAADEANFNVLHHNPEIHTFPNYPLGLGRIPSPPPGMVDDRGDYSVYWDSVISNWDGPNAIDAIYDEDDDEDDEYEVDDDDSASGNFSHDDPLMGYSDEDVTERPVSVELDLNRRLLQTACLIFEGFCYLCKCYVPSGVESMNTHCVGNRHRTHFLQRTDIPLNIQYSREELELHFGGPTLEQQNRHQNPSWRTRRPLPQSRSPRYMPPVIHSEHQHGHVNHGASTSGLPSTSSTNQNGNNNRRYPGRGGRNARGRGGRGRNRNHEPNILGDLDAMWYFGGVPQPYYPPFMG